MDLVLDLGKAEARLPKIEQSRLENYSVGDRLNTGWCQATSYLRVSPPAHLHFETI